MAVFKIEKTKDYTVMSNYHLRDKRLSYKAKGLLSFMLSLPENWDYSVNGLVAVSKESIKSIRSTLKELEDNYYLKRERVQKEKGRFNYEYYVYEQPYNHFGYAVKGHTDNGLQINTNIINTNNKDKIDKRENTHNKLTQNLIINGYLNEEDTHLFLYDGLFNDLLKEFKYEELIIVSDYIARCTQFNRFKDENYNNIESKYDYFKTSIYNNLTKLNNDIELDF